MKTDAFYHIKNIGDKLKSLGAPDRVSDNVNWPNGATVADESVFGTEGIVIASGFLLRKVGTIYYLPRKMDGSFGTPVTLFQNPNFFYHQVEFFDVDGDGQVCLLFNASLIC